MQIALCKRLKPTAAREIPGHRLKDPREDVSEREEEVPRVQPFGRDFEDTSFVYQEVDTDD